MNFCLKLGLIKNLLIFTYLKSLKIWYENEIISQEIAQYK